MKKFRHSRFMAGDDVVLTNAYAGYTEGHVFVVLDPMKRIRAKTISVFDSGKEAQNDIRIPTKYLEKLKKKH